MQNVIQLFSNDNENCDFSPVIVESLLIMWTDKTINAAITKWVLHRLSETGYENETDFGKKVLNNDRRWRSLKVCGTKWRLHEVFLVAKSFDLPLSSFMGRIEGWYLDHKDEIDEYAENPPRIAPGRPVLKDTSN